MFELKIASYNVDNSLKKDQILKNILALKEQGVNIFCLQEVRPARFGKFIGDLLLEGLGPEWQGEFFLTKKALNCDNGLAFFWNKNQITGNKFETLTFSKLSHLDVHEQVFEFVKGSVKEPIQRAALIGDFVINDQRVRISNVHFDWHGWSTHRMKQLTELLDYIKKFPAEREIICGDFNTIGFFGFGRKLQTIQALLGEEYVSAFPNFVMTTSHFQQLDHIFVQNIVIKHSKVFDRPGSDHYPIVATLEL